MKKKLETEHLSPQKADAMVFKSNTYMNIDKMIVNIRKYRNEYEIKRETKFQTEFIERKRRRDYNKSIFPL